MRLGTNITQYRYGFGAFCCDRRLAVSTTALMVLGLHLTATT